jgi:tetratricopeptide (TPR) repeat protein
MMKPPIMMLSPVADLLSQQNDWVGAERSILRALKLNPTSAEVHHTYAVSVLAPTGRLDEAEQASLRAVEIQPSSGSYGEALGRMYYFKREFATALEQWSRVLMRRPGELSSMWRKGQAEMFLGRHQDALATFAAADALTPGISKGQTLIAMARAGAGDIRGARRIRDRLLAQQKRGLYVSPTLLGLIEVGLGDKDAAFAQLMTACHAHADWVRFAKVDPVLDPIRSDPRFAELLRCLKLD